MFKYIAQGLGSVVTVYCAYKAQETVAEEIAKDNPDADTFGYRAAAAFVTTVVVGGVCQAISNTVFGK